MFLSCKAGDRSGLLKKLPVCAQERGHVQFARRRLETILFVSGLLDFIPGQVTRSCFLCRRSLKAAGNSFKSAACHRAGLLLLVFEWPMAFAESANGGVSQARTDRLPFCVPPFCWYRFSWQRSRLEL